MSDTIQLNTIEEAIAEIRAGNVIIVVDDEDRENEGDHLVARHRRGEPGDRQNTEQTLAELYKAHRETPTLLSSDDIRSKIADLFKKNQK